jgi:hypothetical protein
MKKLLVAFTSLALITGAGCGGGGADEILGKMRSFKDKMCKCKDKACVEGVEKEMMEWAMKNMEKMKDMKPTKAQEEAADKIDDEMDKCKEKAEGSGEAPPPATP